VRCTVFKFVLTRPPVLSKSGIDTGGIVWGLAGLDAQNAADGAKFGIEFDWDTCKFRKVNAYVFIYASDLLDSLSYSLSS
jgi:hypothetical protein